MPRSSFGKRAMERKKGLPGLIRADAVGVVRWSWIGIFLWAYRMREGGICWLLRMGFEVKRGTVGDKASDRGQWGRNHEYEKVGKMVRKGREDGKITTEYH